MFMLKKIIPGFVERGMKLTQLGLNYSLKELELSIPRSKEDLLKLKEKQIKHFITVLGDLKGASMKIGQALTLDLIDSWPSEIRPLIQNISFKSNPRPTKDMMDILQKEFMSKTKEIVSFSEEAIAAASIGQVHTAYVQGEKVVFKIQYPGILTSLEHDLKIFKFIVFALTKLYQKDSIDFDFFFSELEQSLVKECDYHEELVNLKTFEHLLKNDPVFIVPKTVEEFSTGKIICMDFCEGLTFDQWLETHPSLQEKSFFAENLLRLLMEEIFNWGLIQSDAHGGNFLIQSVQKKIVLLDFGATRKISSDFRLNYQVILKHAFNKNWQALIKHVTSIGWIDPRENQQVFDLFKGMMEHLATAFEGDFDFKNENFVKLSQKNAMNFARACKFSPPPAELTFVHRKLGGVFFLFRRLEVKLNLEKYREYIKNS